MNEQLSPDPYQARVEAQLQLEAAQANYDAATKAVAKEKARSQFGINQWEARMREHLALKDAADPAYEKAQDPFYQPTPEETAAMDKFEAHQAYEAKMGYESITDDDIAYFHKTEADKAQAEPSQLEQGEEAQEEESAEAEAEEATPLALPAETGPTAGEAPGTDLEVVDEDRAADNEAEAESGEIMPGAEAILRQLSPDLAYDLATALNDYTKLLAQRERRTVHLNKRGYSKTAVEEARAKYEDLRQQAKLEIIKKLQASPDYTPAEIKLISILDDKTEVAALRSAGRFEAEKLGRNSRFINWWARQGGHKLLSRAGLAGKLKKTGVMLAVGLPIGLVAGAIAAPLAGTAAAAAGGVFVASRVARGLMAGKINKDAEAATVGGKQYDRRYDDQIAAVDDYYTPENNDDYYWPNNVTTAFAEGAERSVRRNRRRAAIGAGMAAIMGVAGAEISDWVGTHLNDLHLNFNNPFDNHNGPETSGRGANHDTPKKIPGNLDEKSDRQPKAWKDHVAKGDGLTDSIIDYANEQGRQISPERSYRIFQTLKQEGLLDNEVSLNGQMNVQGGIGYTRPGVARWSPEVIARMNELMKLDDQA